jgi:hypothetical protein
MVQAARRLGLVQRSRQLVQQVGHLDRDAGGVAALFFGAGFGLRLRFRW